MKTVRACLTLLMWTQYGVKLRWLMLGMMVVMGGTFYLYASQPVGDLYKMFYAQDTVRDYFFESFFILQIGILTMVLAQSIRIRNHPFAWAFMMVLIGRKRLWWLRWCVVHGMSIFMVWMGLLMMQVMLRWMPYDTGFTFTYQHFAAWALWIVFYQTLFLFFEERAYSAFGIGLTMLGALLSLTLMPLNPNAMNDVWLWGYSLFPAIGFFPTERFWLGRWNLSLLFMGWIAVGSYVATLRKDYSASIET